MPMSAMREAYKKVGAVLWVVPDEADAFLRYRNFGSQIRFELSDWIARMFSMAFVAGQRGIRPPEISNEHVLRVLGKMNYPQKLADELTGLIVPSLLGLYEKGQSRTNLR